MQVEELARSLTDSLYRKLRSLWGGQIAAARAAGVGKNYWTQARDRGSIGLRGLLYALRQLALSPAEFFESRRSKQRASAAPPSHTERIDELLIRHQNGRLSARRAMRLANDEQDADLGSRLYAVAGTCWLSKGKSTKALDACRKARELAVSTLADAEAAGLRVSIALDCCELELARGVATSLAGRALARGDAETLAFAHYKLGLVLAYSGELSRAEEQWTRSLELTGRPLYRVSTAHGLAKIASEKGRDLQAWRLLESAPPLSDRQKLFAASTTAKLHTRTLNFKEAVTAQRRAVELSSSRSLVDQAMLSIDLVRYLALAGEEGEAMLLVARLAKILWALEEKGEKAAAVALRELINVTNAADLVRLCREAKANLADLANQRGGRFLRRPSRR